METISVIVPSYNVEPYLRRCAETIIHQTYQKLEIILVDDGSTDGTGALCDEIAGEDSRIRVIHKENGGLADARNAGLAIATGEYVSFIDADDYIELTMYEQMIAEMKDETVSIVAVGFIETDTKGNTRILAAEKKLSLTGEEAIMNLFEDGRLFPSSVNKLFRRSLFQELRFVKGINNEDTEIIYRLLAICDHILVLDQAAYHYVLRNGSITQSDFGIKDYESLVAYKSARNVCKKSFPELLPYANYYELSELHLSLGRMADSGNHAALRGKAFRVRIRMAGRLLRCLGSATIRRQYHRELLIYTTAILLGYRIMYRLMMMKQKIRG